MSFVRTVRGDIAAADLGVCYAHEHILIDRSYTTERNPEFCINDVEAASAELMDFYAAGGRAMVDSMPCDSGRNVVKLAEISRRSGVHIVCPTGLHLQKYYPEGHWGERLGAEQLAELFVADIEAGVDANDYGGPVLERTAHRAGVIKIASGLDRLNAHEQKLFAAAAEAHRRTGAPILTHTEQGTAAVEQIERLAGEGVPLAHVVLSHTDRKPDPAYHRDLLQTGVVLEYDSAFRWKGDDNPTMRLVTALLPEFPGQIVLGMDAARRAYWKHYGGKPGLTFLLTDFTRQLAGAGIDGDFWQALFVRNPAHAYTFADVLQ